jgi:hypothetical protein
MTIQYLSKKILNLQKFTFPYILLNNNSSKNSLVKPTKNHFYSIEDFVLFKQQFPSDYVDIKNCLVQQCNNNVSTLYLIIKELLENIKKLDISLINHSYSISAYAVNYYLKKYNLIQKKINKNIDDIIRDAYYGGRCEVFGNALDSEYTFHFDFKGMYSMCMKNKLPTKNFVYEELCDFIKPGFYKISFTSSMQIPVLPVRTDLLYFPNGTYDGIY